MLVFRTICPLNNKATLQDLINISIKWIDRSPHYNLNGKLSACYGKKEFEEKTEFEKFECITHEKDNNSYACVSFEKKENDKKWTTEIVYRINKKNTLLSINTYCEAQNFENILKETNKPYLLKLIDKEIGFEDDGHFTTNNNAHTFLSNEVEEAYKIVSGNFESYLPCIYVSINETGEYSVNIEEISNLLLGVAHVFVEPNIYFSMDLRKKTQGRNPYLGAVGIFFPNKGKERRIVPQAEHNYIIKTRSLFNAVKNSLNFGVQPEELSFNNIKTQRLRDHYKLKEKDNDRQAMLDYALSENKQQENTIEKQKEEIHQLKMRLENLENRSNKNSNASLINKGEEFESYQGQIHDAIIEIIEEYRNNNRKVTRKRNIIDDILKHNKKIGQKEKIIEELKNIFNGYRCMTDSIESKLKKLGFSIDKSSPHYKLHFTSYPQISLHLPASGSDNRGGKNCVSDIKKILL